MDIKQFDKLIAYPILNSLLPPEIPYSSVAHRLILETIYHESQRMIFIAQNPNYGPAHGFLQMEQPTFQWLVNDVIPKLNINSKFRKISFTFPDMQFDELNGNLYLNVVMCRIRYYAVPYKLPENNLESRADYWYKFYNASGVPERRENFIKDAKYLATILS